MPAKVWKMRPSPLPGFAESLGLPPFHAHLLYNRGIRHPDELDPFLTADHRLANDPALLPDMDKAVDRLQHALSDGEVIGVFGDFDTDGVTGTAVVVQALRELGATVIPYLPDRVDEGHGLNAAAVESLRAQGVTLLITVDCGVSSAQEVELASSMGIDTIITDHHSLPDDPPNARAVVNPSRGDSVYPYSGLTGVGLAFKLIEGLSAALDRPPPDHLLELVALGTVADVGPLTGENRHLVKRGLERLNATQHPGLRALIARAGLQPGNLDTESLSFGLIPRLNAAGRMGDASVSLDLLTASSTQIAEPIAESLDVQNEERRQLTHRSLAEAHEQVDGYGESPIIIVEHPSWLPGILGLIAGNLSESFYRPAVAVSLNGGVARGSARSIPEFNIVQALERSRELFQRFGGHPQAAGFTLPASELPRLRSQLEAAAGEELNGTELSPSIHIDCEIAPALLDDARNMVFIQSLSPYGEGNPAPVFLTRNARIVSARQVGKQRNHLKLQIAHGGKGWEAIAFRQGDTPAAPGDRVDMVYTAGMNDWGGRRTLQLGVMDFRPAR